MKQGIENAMLKASIDYETRQNRHDHKICKGAIIQVTNPKSKHIGKIGKIIKIWHSAIRRNPCCTIRFADHKSVLMRTSSFRVVSKADD